MIDPQSEERNAQARQLLKESIARLNQGVRRVVVALAVFWSFSQLVWLTRIATGVGFDQAWQGGAFGAALWSIVKFTVAAMVVGIGALPALQSIYGDLIRRGVAVPAKITRGPDFVLARLFGAALDVLLLDTLLGYALPARLVTFEVEFDSHRYGDLSGAMYADEDPQVYDSSKDPAFALVDPYNPGRRAWLIRRRRSR